jgi:hypothetical protein
VVTAETGGCRVRLDNGPEVSVTGISAKAGEPIKLYMRGERASVGAPSADEPGVTVIAGTISASDYLGVLTRYVVDIAGVPFVVLQSTSGPVMRPGDRVTIRVPADAWMTF